MSMSSYSSSMSLASGLTSPGCCLLTTLAVSLSFPVLTSSLCHNAICALQCKSVIDDAPLISKCISVKSVSHRPLSRKNTKTCPPNTRPGSSSTRHAQHQTFSWEPARFHRAVAPQSRYEHNATTHAAQGATFHFSAHGHF